MFILAILSEENHENLRGLEGGCVHRHLTKLYIDIISEEHHEKAQYNRNRFIGKQCSLTDTR
jgi:hypothetical protein